MTLHFTWQPGADRGTSIELTQPVLVDLRAERAAMGVASYYHPEGGTMSAAGTDPLDAPQRRNLSLEFATQEGRTYVVESTRDLATGQWEVLPPSKAVVATR